VYKEGTATAPFGVWARRCGGSARSTRGLPQKRALPLAKSGRPPSPVRTHPAIPAPVHDIRQCWAPEASMHKPHIPPRPGSRCPVAVPTIPCQSAGARGWVCARRTLARCASCPPMYDPYVPSQARLVSNTHTYICIREHVCMYACMCLGACMCVHAESAYGESARACVADGGEDGGGARHQWLPSAVVLIIQVGPRVHQPHRRHSHRPKRPRHINFPAPPAPLSGDQVHQARPTQYVVRRCACAI
jgi:hypothetical protein